MLSSIRKETQLHESSGTKFTLKPQSNISNETAKIIKSTVPTIDKNMND